MAAPSFLALVGVVDAPTASVAGAILAIAALLVVPYVVQWGVRKVLSMVGGGFDLSDGADDDYREQEYLRSGGSAPDGYGSAAADDGYRFQTMSNDDSRDLNGRSYHDWNYWNKD